MGLSKNTKISDSFKFTIVSFTAYHKTIQGWGTLNSLFPRVYIIENLSPSQHQFYSSHVFRWDEPLHQLQG